jgi:hypothetical protein
MSDYLKQKAPKSKDATDFLKKERSFNQGMQELKSAPVEMVDDFQKKVVKDLPVEHINKLGEPQKITSGADFLAQQVIGQAERDAKRAALGKVSGDALDYKQLKKEFADKARQAARSGAGRKLLGTVPLVGGLLSAAMSGDASAAVPLLDSAESLGPQAGTLDDRIARGQLTEDDKQALAMEQARIKALQSLK